MSPIPPACGYIKMHILRNKSGMNKLQPSFYLSLEKGNGGNILILYAKKLPFKKQSYYLISLEKNKQRTASNIIGDDSDTCLGKLRALEG